MSAAAAVSVAPWWGIPLFTLAGAVLGGLAGQGLGMVNDWRKARGVRADADVTFRREALLKFLADGNTVAVMPNDSARNVAFDNQHGLMRLLFTGELADKIHDYYAVIMEIFGAKNAREHEALAGRFGRVEDELLRVAQSLHKELGLPAAVGSNSE